MEYFKARVISKNFKGWWHIKFPRGVLVVKWIPYFREK